MTQDRLDTITDILKNVGEVIQDQQKQIVALSAISGTLLGALQATDLLTTENAEVISELIEYTSPHSDHPSVQTIIKLFRVAAAGTPKMMVVSED